MDPTVWLNRLADAVHDIVPNLSVERVDADTIAFARGNVVCTVHVVARTTVGIVVSRRGAGVGATHVAHDDPHHEAIDELSLITLPRAIAVSLNPE